jgi:hypothetical protein
MPIPNTNGSASMQTWLGSLQEKLNTTGENRE